MAVSRLQVSVYVDRFGVISRIITTVIGCDATSPLVTRLL